MKDSGQWLSWWNNMQRYRWPTSWALSAKTIKILIYLFNSKKMKENL
jgi:hypothetical protein